MSVARDRLTIKLTREMWGTEARHVEVARAISRIARERGATADRAAVQEVQLAVAAKPDDIDLPFWRAVLGYAPHVDVSVARDVAEQRLAAALAAGGRIVDESEAPASWILADRAGNKVCIAAWPDGARPAESAE